MNLESLKYHLIEKIVMLQDDTLLKKIEQVISENQPTNKKIISTPKKNGIVQRRSIYRISDRPKAVATKSTRTKVVEPVKVVRSESNSDTSLGKLQRLVRERALSNHALDI